MDINNRIRVDNNELFQLIDEKLDKLQQIRYNPKYKELLGDNIMEKLNVWEKNIRNQKDVPLTVVVCGEFKRGKSTLINALLGEDVATTNVTTETITVNRISYGEHSNELVLKNGKRLILTDDELKCENLEGILAELSKTEKVTVLELKRPIEILKDITIIDTPGLGDSIKDFTEEVDFALKQADAVIYTFSMSYPLSMNEQFFIKTAIKPQKYTDLYLVANSCDIAETEEDFEKMKGLISQRIENILPGEEPYMLSALDERCRQLEKKLPNEDLSQMLASNFEKFRDDLNYLLRSKRHMVLPDRMERLMKAMLNDIGADIEIINSGLSASIEDLKNKKIEIENTKTQYGKDYEKILNDINDKLEVHKSNAGSWMMDFVCCMENDVDSLKTFSAADIKKYYSVFCVDALQNAIEKCNDYFAEEVYNELETVSVDIAKSLSMKSETSKTNFAFTLNTHTWTKGDKIQFANNALTSIGANFGLANVLMTFIAGSVRESELKKKTPDLVNAIKEQYPGLKLSILPELSKNYSEISENAKKQLISYFTDKRDELDSNLAKAESIAAQDEEKKQEIKMAVDEISAILRDISEGIA
ncbi:MAG: dynamin family protein [Clostridia bacterium]|nr:dynamin family protein [Clostridia bacterium]